MQSVVTRKRATTGRFASLMELYESNYMLVRLLAPGLRTMGTLQASVVEPPDCTTREVFVSEVEGCLDLELGYIEHEKYTTTFNLTYRFVSDDRNPREPDLMIRIYHDARTCEVMSGLLQGTRHGPLRTRDLTEGYRLNRFLQKWVRYCIRQGHSFKPGAYRSCQIKKTPTSPDEHQHSAD